MVCTDCGRGLRGDNKTGYCTKTPGCRQKYNQLKNSGRQDRAYFQAWRAANPDSQMLASARERAKRAGVPCTITREDIQAVWAKTCPVFGYEMAANHDGSRAHARNSFSLDRIDPAKGYVAGNIQILSQRANSMKSDATPEELLQFAAWIQATYGGD